MSKTNIRRRRIGALECFEVLNDPQGPYVVLMHGFGADFQDLLPLHQMIAAPKGTNWIFPNASTTVQLGPHMEGRAWFPISLAAMEQASQGAPLDLTLVQPPGMAASRRKVEDMLRQLDVPLSRVVLGGFSQGAILAAEVAMSLPAKPAQ